MKTKYISCFLAVFCVVLSSSADEQDLILQTKKWFGDDLYYSGGDPFSTKEYADYLRRLSLGKKDPKVEEAVVNMTYERIMSFDPMWVTNACDQISLLYGIEARGFNVNNILVHGSISRTFNDEQIFNIAAKIGTIQMIPKRNWAQEAADKDSVLDRRNYRMWRINANGNFSKYRCRLIDVLAKETCNRMCELSDKEFIVYTNKITTLARLVPEEQFRCFDDNIKRRLWCIWCKMREKQPRPVYDFVHDRTITHDTPVYNLYESQVLEERFVSENYTRTNFDEEMLSRWYKTLKDLARKQEKELSSRNIPDLMKIRPLVRWVYLMEEEAKLRKIPAAELDPDYPEIRKMIDPVAFK